MTRALGQKEKLVLTACKAITQFQMALFIKGKFCGPLAQSVDWTF